MNWNGWFVIYLISDHGYCLGDFFFVKHQMMCIRTGVKSDVVSDDWRGMTTFGQSEKPICKTMNGMLILCDQVGVRVVIDLTYRQRRLW